MILAFIQIKCQSSRLGNVYGNVHFCCKASLTVKCFHVPIDPRRFLCISGVKNAVQVANWHPHGCSRRPHQKRDLAPAVLLALDASPLTLSAEPLTFMICARPPALSNYASLMLGPRQCRPKSSRLAVAFPPGAVNVNMGEVPEWGYHGGRSTP
jgi:hypothetical protein